MFVLFAVIDNTKKIKKIVDKLQEIGIKGATIIDTVGGWNYCNGYSLEKPAIGTAMKTVENGKKYNKTIMSLVYCEKHVIAAMDAIEEILGGDMNKPGTGIIFSVPVKEFRGGELHRYLIEHPYCK